MRILDISGLELAQGPARVGQGAEKNENAYRKWHADIHFHRYEPFSSSGIFLSVYFYFQMRFDRRLNFLGAVGRSQPFGLRFATEFKGDRRPFPLGAHNVDRPVVVTNYLINDRKPKAGPARAGSRKRLKKLFHLFGGHAAAGVREHDLRFVVA